MRNHPASTNFASDKFTCSKQWCRKESNADESFKRYKIAKGETENPCVLVTEDVAGWSDTTLCRSRWAESYNVQHRKRKEIHILGRTPFAITAGGDSK